MQMAIDVAGFTPAESDELRQAMGSKRCRARMEQLKRAAVRRDGRARHHRRRRRRDLREDEGVRQLRLPRVALCQLRLPRVRLVVDQVPRAGGVLRGAAQRPADGLLEPAHARPGRPPPRRGGAHPRPQRLAGDGHAGAVRRVGRRCRRAAGDRVGARRRHRPGQGDRGAARPYASLEDLVRRVPSLHLPSSRRWPRPGCSASASGSTAARRCGRSVRRRSRGRIGCRASSPANGRRACPAWPRWRRSSPTCGRPASRPTATPRSSCATSSPSSAWSRRTGCGSASRSKVLVAGVVTHRQRPMTAQGMTFLNLEDETGLINVVVSKGCWARFRTVARRRRRC